MLNDSDKDYKIYKLALNHPFDMIYLRNNKNLKFLLETVKDFSDDIGMEFGLHNLAKAKLKTAQSSNIMLKINTYIRNLHEKVYK